LFAITVKTFAISQGIMPRDQRIDAILERVTLERAIVAGVIMFVAGMALIAVAVNAWRETAFGNLDYERTMRWVLPGAGLTALGFQTILSGFLLGILHFFRGDK